MAWEENSRICLHMQLIAILSRTEVYVGWVEAFLLAILKETGEIVATDWANPCSIVSYIAKNQGAFWDVLVELEKFSQKLVFGFITEKEENEINKYIQSVAGGSKYNPIN